MAENNELALVLKLVADQFQSELKNSQGALSQFNTFIKDWRTQLAAAGTALFAVAKSTANFGEEALKGAQKAGQTVETFTALAHAAHMADLSQQQLIVGLKSLSQNMVEAQQKTGDGEAIFRRLGVAVVDSAQKLRSTHDVLLELADVFAKSADGAGKADAAVKLFGKAGLELIPFLNQGKSGIVELEKEAQRLGLTFSKEDAEAASKFNEELKRLEEQMRGLMLTAGKPLVGVLNELSEMFRSLTANSAAQTFFTALSAQAVMFNTLIKEVSANVEFLFGKMTFEKLKAEIGRIEEEAHKKLFILKHPGADALLNPREKGGQDPRPQATVGAGKLEDPGKEQERIGKALVEIYLLQNRALEIKNRLATEHLAMILQEDKAERERQGRLEDAAIEEAKGRRIVTDTQELLRGQEQEQLGRQIVQQTQAQLAITEQLRRESMGFFDHWREGMQRYVQDTKSGFGFAQDMARRTAQVMEQSFRTFFLDMMNGQIKSLKDLFRGLLDFVKQIIAQITAQLVAAQVMKLVTAGVGAFSGGAGFGSGAAANQWFGGFATGGSFVVGGSGGTDSQRVGFMATPGERVTVDRPGQQHGGGATINITVNADGGMRQGGSGAQPNLTELARNIGKAVQAILVDEQRPGGLLAARA